MLTIAEGDQNFIPFAVVDAGGAHGMYIGWEWSIGRIAIACEGTAGKAAIKAGNGERFKTDLAAGEVFEVPPGFIGAYRGDLDDAANSLHKYLFNYSMPATVRTDPTYPKVEWNAFAAAGQGQGSWQPTETKYYPLIDDIAPLGFEEVVIDVGWWNGDTTHQPHPPVGHAKFWSKGMLAACDYAHKHGMRFGLYWNCNPPMTTAEGIQHRKDDFKYLHDKFHIDFYRTDSTAGPVLQTGRFGPKCRAHYAEDLGYWQTKGFYEVTDWLCGQHSGLLLRELLRRGQHQGLRRDAAGRADPGPGPVLPDRRAAGVLRFLLRPAPHADCHLCGSWAEWQASGSVYEFRSASLGARLLASRRAQRRQRRAKMDRRPEERRSKGGEHLQDEDPAAGPRGQPLPHLPPPGRQGLGRRRVFRSRGEKRGRLRVPARQSEAERNRQAQRAGCQGPLLAVVRGRLDPADREGRRRADGGRLRMRLPAPFSSDIVFLQDVSLGKPAALP